MKKYFILMASLAACLFISCEKEIVDPDPAQSSYSKGGTVLEPTNQQKKIENTALAVMNEVNPQDVKPMVDLVNHFMTKCYQGSDLNDIYDEIEKRVESAYRYDTIQISDNENVNVRYFEELMLQFSLITGNIDATTTKWTITPSDKLTISFIGPNGENCVLEGTANGKFFVLDTYSNTWIDYVGKIEHVYRQGVIIPETFKVTVSVDNSELFRIEYTANGNVDECIEKESIKNLNFMFSSTIYCAGYSFDVKKLSFNSNAAELSSAISKNGKVLISEKLAVSDYASLIAETSAEPVMGGGKVDVKINILGELQITSGIKDIIGFITMMNEIDSEGFVMTPEFADRFNSAFLFEIHFDNTAAVQGKLEIKCIDGEAVWVVVLKDGSSVALFGEYITNEMMQSVSAKMEELANEINALIPSQEIS